MNNNEPRPYINPYLGGLLLGLVLYAAYFLTGNGLGASGAINRIQVFLLDLFASKHVDRVAYFANLAGGEKNPLDTGAVIMLLGTFLGGMVSGYFNEMLKFLKDWQSIQKRAVLYV